MDTKSSHNEDELTVAEAYIHLKFKCKRKEIQLLQEEISELEREKHKNTEMLERVKKEQEGPIKDLWRQAKEQQRKLDEREVMSREEVEEALQHNLDTAHSEQAQLTELHSKLSHEERQVLDLEAECRTWLQYKDTGSQEYQAQITNLEEELDRRQRDFEKAADNIKYDLEATFNEIDKETAQLIDENKRIAAERAINHLDMFSKQEIKEKKWLQKEIAICDEVVSNMALSVQSLEDENLQHINWLVEQRMEDFNLSRNILLTQAVGPSDQVQKQSPKSPTSVTERDVWEATKFLEGDETDRSCSSAPQDLWVLLDRSQSPLMDELLHLGDPQQLVVVGQAVLLHPFPSEDDDEWDSLVPKDRGPLTTQILNKFK